MIDWGNARPLNEVAVIATRNWMTPRVSTGGYTRDRGDPEKERLTLEGQARFWCTPSVAISTGGQSSRSGDRQGEELLTGQARSVVTDLKARSVAPYVERNVWPTATALNRPRSDDTLEKCLAYREAKAGQTTVPLYLEEVATFLFSPPDPPISEHGDESSPSDPSSPPLSLNPLFVAWLMGWTVPASTNSGFTEMGSSRWLALMRSELSRIGLPPAAPPAQLSLFG